MAPWPEGKQWAPIRSTAANWADSNYMLLLELAPVAIGVMFHATCCCWNRRSVGTGRMFQTTCCWWNWYRSAFSWDVVNYMLLVELLLVSIQLGSFKLHAAVGIRTGRHGSVESVILDRLFE
jgi:hypothetical protein